MLKSLISIFHPEQFQGWGKTNQYFEGWYFKVVNADETKAFAFIPGIAMDENGTQHAFIQVLDGKNRTASYNKFSANDFNPKFGRFEITLAGSFFSSDFIKLDLPTVKGKLKFSGLVSWPNTWYSPGIMGPYSFVPFMECYHGILSMDHRIEGQLEINGEIIDFENGRGYMEKDWGQSFPSAYLWLQSNHFSQKGIALKVSVAKIPWLGNSFVGFIAGIWFSGKLIQFTTYNGTRLLKSFADSKEVVIVLQNKNYKLEINAQREKSTILVSPIRGFMEGRIEESMTANIDVKLIDRKTKEILLADTGRNAGLEVAGDISEIFVV